MSIQENNVRHHAKIHIRVVPVISAAPQKHYARSAFQFEVNHDRNDQYYRRVSAIAQSNDTGCYLQRTLGLEKSC